jgi:hypothetical protein
MRQVTFCLVEEVERSDWGIGGKAMTTADVHALARGKGCVTTRRRSRRTAPGPPTAVRAPPANESKAVGP